MVDSFYRIAMIVSKLNIHALDMLVWHVSKKLLNMILPFYYKHSKLREGESPRKYTQTEVIVSLTSFPARMKTIPLVLETLYRQSIKADRIILWLADNQYPDKNAVKKQLRRYVEIGLEIRYCDDLRSHKKYYYSMMENPESIIVTCDDDIIYSEYMLERLLSTAQEYPDMIVCERAHEITFNDGKVADYDNWKYRARGVRGPSLLLCPTGCAGCLYPPKSVSSHVFDVEQIQQICFFADDIWLKCMSFMVGTKVVLTRINNPEIFDTEGTNKSGLAKLNVEQNLNDKQFQEVSNYYSIKWTSN